MAATSLGLGLLCALRLAAAVSHHERPGSLLHREEGFGTPGSVLIQISSTGRAGKVRQAAEAIQSGAALADESEAAPLDVKAAAQSTDGVPLEAKTGIAYDLLVVVPVTFKEIDRRDAIRASWARYTTSPRCESCKRHKVGLVFVAGNESGADGPHAEAVAHGDFALLEDFGQPQYYTLRAEKTLQTIRYAVRYFSFKLLLKTDSDSWVFLDRLLDDLDARSLWSKGRLYAGDFEDGKGARPNKDEGSKWFDPMYPMITGLDEYPTHAKGAGYVLSRTLCEALALQPDGFWQDMPSEDVAVGFWLFAVRHEKQDLKVSIAPNCNGGAVIDHYISPEVMAKRWSAYEAGGDPC